MPLLDDVPLLYSGPCRDRGRMKPHWEWHVVETLFFPRSRVLTKVGPWNLPWHMGFNEIC